MTAAPLPVQSGPDHEDEQPAPVVVHDLVAQARRHTRDAIDLIASDQSSSKMPVGLAHALESVDAYARSATRVLMALTTSRERSDDSVPASRYLPALEVMTSNRADETMPRPVDTPGTAESPVYAAARAWGGVADLLAVNPAMLALVPDAERQALARQAVLQLDQVATALHSRCQDGPDLWVAGRTLPDWAERLAPIAGLGRHDDPGLQGQDLTPGSTLAQQRVHFEPESALLTRLREWEALANGVLRDPHVHLKDVRVAAIISARVAQFAHHITETIPRPHDWTPADWDQARTGLKHSFDRLASIPDALPGEKVYCRTTPNAPLDRTGRELVASLGHALRDRPGDDELVALVKAGLKMQPVIARASASALEWLASSQQLVVNTHEVRQNETQLANTTQYLAARRHHLIAPAAVEVVRPAVITFDAIAGPTAAVAWKIDQLPPIRHGDPHNRSKDLQERARKHAEATAPECDRTLRYMAANWTLTYATTPIPPPSAPKAPPGPPR